MKKIVFVFMVSVLASCLLRADLVREEIAPDPDKPNFKTTVWLRDGVKIMSQRPANSQGVSVCLIGPFHQGGAALAILFKNGKISGVFSGPGLNGYLFVIEDVTGDGVPDFILISEPQKGESDAGKVVGTYTIVNGIVEPLPDRLLKSNDNEIVAYLKEKRSEANRTNQPKAP